MSERIRNWCHPPQAQRTKCVCGQVLGLRGAYGENVRVCKCGRKHRKAPGSAFQDVIKSGGFQSRPGGAAGCPGLDRLWTMPKWMEPYRKHIRNTGGNTIERMMNGNADPVVNLPLSTLQTCVKSQVSLLMHLHENGYGFVKEV